MRFSLYRYNPETDAKPRMQDFDLASVPRGMMLLDALLRFKEQDEGLAFRHSCGEGHCGADGVNVNGVNLLACTTRLSDLREPVVVRPMPGLPVIRDLVVDMQAFFDQYRAVRPYLIADDPEPEVERRQSPEQRAELDGSFECILCGCCTMQCPSWQSNPDKFLGPAALLQAWRFLSDSRDTATAERLERLDGPYALFRCRTVMNCVNVCPKDLNPTEAIGRIRRLMLKTSL